MKYLLQQECHDFQGSELVVGPPYQPIYSWALSHGLCRSHYYGPTVRARTLVCMLVACPTHENLK